MSVNRERPYVVIVPEDDENRQIINGFLLQPDIFEKQIRVTKPAGGWIKAMEQAGNELGAANAFVVAVIDFDDVDARYSAAIERIPEGCRDRVAILGCRKEPVDLRRLKHGSLEGVGGKLAEECHSGVPELWKHDLLAHNASEIERVRDLLCPILSGSN